MPAIWQAPATNYLVLLVLRTDTEIMATLPMNADSVVALLTSATPPRTATRATDPFQLARPLIVNTTLGAVSCVGRLLTHGSSLCSRARASIP